MKKKPLHVAPAGRSAMCASTSTGAEKSGSRSVDVKRDAAGAGASAAARGPAGSVRAQGGQSDGGGGTEMADGAICSLKLAEGGGAGEASRSWRLDAKGAIAATASVIEGKRSTCAFDSARSTAAATSGGTSGTPDSGSGSCESTAVSCATGSLVGPQGSRPAKSS